MQQTPGPSTRPVSMQLTMFSPEGITPNRYQGATALSSGSITNSGVIHVIPLVLPEPVTLTQAFWYNGSSALGNIDVGIYDHTFSRIVSTGSRGQLVQNTIEVTSIPATDLPPGRYYLALAMASSSGNFVGFGTPSGTRYAMAGGLYSQTSGTIMLPSVIVTSMMPTIAAPLPLAGFSQGSFGL